MLRSYNGKNYNRDMIEIREICGKMNILEITCFTEPEGLWSSHGKGMSRPVSLINVDAWDKKTD